MRYLLLIMCVFCAPAFAATGADPLLYKVQVEELEWRNAEGGNKRAWDIEGWVGKDRDKLWIKTEGESSSDDTEEFELQLLYDRAVAPNWDLQLGWRGDFQPESRRSWLTIGMQGLAPGFIETDAAVFLASDGRTAARVRASYELLFTQKLILQPGVELNWYAEDDEVNGLGSGWSSFELGLRLRYHVTRKFAPYAGLHWDRKFGETADLAEAAGEETGDLQFVAGLSVWF
ncbi:MAG: copper resistance protein B [Gammaproteobacteria bacterium]|nr:copper resistance protein B [Gammaproteobacteria bacterium]MDP6616420.1 copper resistance protein B [Gammaproteobacteria bacterium]MDP6695699.1 copper resistance protein B [Gammaproteobacteria bacterium]